MREVGQEVPIEAVDSYFFSSGPSSDTTPAEAAATAATADTEPLPTLDPPPTLELVTQPGRLLVLFFQTAHNPSYIKGQLRILRARG